MIVLTKNEDIQDVGLPLLQILRGNSIDLVFTRDPVVYSKAWACRGTYLELCKTMKRVKTWRSHYEPVAWLLIKFWSFCWSKSSRELDRVLSKVDIWLLRLCVSAQVWNNVACLFHSDLQSNYLILTNAFHAESKNDNIDRKSISSV